MGCGHLRHALTLMLSSSTGLERSDTSTCRFNAKDVALLTRPSISAPLKFFVLAAHQPSSAGLLRMHLPRQCKMVATGGCFAIMRTRTSTPVSIPASTPRSTSRPMNEFWTILLVCICSTLQHSVDLSKAARHHTVLLIKDCLMGASSAWTNPCVHAGQAFVSRVSHHHYAA